MYVKTVPVSIGLPDYSERLARSLRAYRGMWRALGGR